MQITAGGIFRFKLVYSYIFGIIIYIYITDSLVGCTCCSICPGYINKGDVI